jgi:hypothetical protein
VANTATEDLLKQLKRTQRSKAVVVPLIEKFLQKPVEINDAKDRQFLSDLIEARSQPRKKGVYSPSMLASCVRQVYFTKKKVQKRSLHRIESSAIFLDGNFRHFKWQFLIWKMHRAGVIELIDCDSLCLGTEVYVENAKGDFGGTIDNIVYIPSVDLVATLDWKGMNGNSFLKSVDKGPGLSYIAQSVGYAGLANYSLRKVLPKKIESVFILGENKNGAVRTRIVNSPVALYEWQLDMDIYRPMVAARLKLLRAHERKNEPPPPECTSTRRLMFKDCPYAPLCRGEIERMERIRNGKAKLEKPRKKPKVMFNAKRKNSE